MSSDRPAGATQADQADRWVVQFTTSASASADAHALAHVGRVRFDLVVDGVALVVSVFLLATGATVFGLIIGLIALLSLVGSRFHPLRRALIAWRFRTILGQPSTVTIDETGLRSENALGVSFMPWSSVSAVRSTSRTLAFFRDHVLLGYVPSSAFESPVIQEQVAAFARSRISPSR